jgi:hypothetical protein
LGGHDRNQGAGAHLGKQNGLADSVRQCPDGLSGHGESVPVSAPGICKVVEPWPKSVRTTAPVLGDHAVSLQGAQEPLNRLGLKLHSPPESTQGEAFRLFGEQMQQSNGPVNRLNATNGHSGVMTHAQGSLTSLA